MIRQYSRTSEKFSGRKIKWILVPFLIGLKNYFLLQIF